jgi:hypothetical protein
VCFEQYSLPRPRVASPGGSGETLDLSAPAPPPPSSPLLPLPEEAAGLSPDGGRRRRGLFSHAAASWCGMNQAVNGAAHSSDESALGGISGRAAGLPRHAIDSSPTSWCSGTLSLRSGDGGKRQAPSGPWLASAGRVRVAASPPKTVDGFSSELVRWHLNALDTAARCFSSVPTGNEEGGGLGVVVVW